MRQRLTAQVGRSLYVVETKDITHFTAEAKYVTVHSPYGELLFDGTLKALEEEFNDDFIRIHRSFLVRKCLLSDFRWKGNNWTVRIHGTTITLPVSRRKQQEVSELFGLETQKSA